MLSYCSCIFHILRFYFVKLFLWNIHLKVFLKICFYHLMRKLFIVFFSFKKQTNKQTKCAKCHIPRFYFVAQICRRRWSSRERFIIKWGIMKSTLLRVFFKSSNNFNFRYSAFILIVIKLDGIFEVYLLSTNPCVCKYLFLISNKTLCLTN